MDVSVSCLSTGGWISQNGVPGVSTNDDYPGNNIGTFGRGYLPFADSCKKYIISKRSYNRWSSIDLYVPFVFRWSQIVDLYIGLDGLRHSTQYGQIRSASEIHGRNCWSNFATSISQGSQTCLGKHPDCSLTSWECFINHDPKCVFTDHCSPLIICSNCQQHPTNINNQNLSTFLSSFVYSWIIYQLRRYVEI